MESYVSTTPLVLSVAVVDRDIEQRGGSAGEDKREDVLADGQTR